MSIDDERRRLERAAALGDEGAMLRLHALEERLGVRKRRNLVLELEEFVRERLDVAPHLTRLQRRMDRDSGRTTRLGFRLRDVRAVTQVALKTPFQDVPGWAWARSSIVLGEAVPQQFVVLAVRHHDVLSVGIRFWDGRSPEDERHWQAGYRYGGLTLPNRTWWQLDPWLRIAHDHPVHNVVPPPFEVYARWPEQLEGDLCSGCGRALRDQQLAERSRLLDARVAAWASEGDLAERGVYRIPLREAIDFAYAAEEPGTELAPSR